MLSSLARYDWQAFSVIFYLFLNYSGSNSPRLASYSDLHEKVSFKREFPGPISLSDSELEKRRIVLKGEGQDTPQLAAVSFMLFMRVFLVKQLCSC
jgi:hypothetical protein